MRMTRSVLSLALAGAVPASGCTTVHLGGSYRADRTDLESTGRIETIDEGSSWPLFWGLAEAGSYDARGELARRLRRDEELTDVEVHEHVSVGGVFLWIITAGLVSHHTIEVRGAKCVAGKPPAAQPTAVAPSPAATPPAPVPAGYKKEPARTEETPKTEPPAPPPTPAQNPYGEGYKDGLKDQGGVFVPKDGAAKTEPARDYNEGYRDAVGGE